MYTSNNGMQVYPVTLLARGLIAYAQYALFISLALSLELIFPLFGDGPFFTSASDSMLQQCTDNWWHVYLLPVTQGGNLTSCASHVYLSSISVQCLLMGIVILLLMRKLGERATLSLCSLICTLLLMSAVYASLAKPSTISQQMPPDNFSPLSTLILRHHFHDIHFLSPLYSHGFILGVMTAFHVDRRMHLSSLPSLKYTLHMIIGNIFTASLFLYPSLGGLVSSSSSSSTYFLSLRTQLASQFALSVFCIFFPLSKHSLHEKHIPSRTRQLIQVCATLSPSVLLSASLYSRWYFLTNRHAPSHLARDLLVRWTHALYIVSAVSFFLHLLFIEPFTRRLKSVAINRRAKID